MTPARPTETADLREAQVETVASALWFDQFGAVPGLISWTKAVAQAEQRGSESAAAEQVERFRYRARALIAGPLATLAADLNAALTRADRADTALAERDEARNLAYELKLAAVGGEDAPGSANLVTVEDVNRWRVEASQREESATARANRVKELMLRFGLRSIRREALLRSALAEREARIAILLKVIDAGKCEAAFAFADEADGSSTATTRRIRLENIRNALDGVGDIDARKALGLLIETIDGEPARAALSQGATDADA